MIINKCFLLAQWKFFFFVFFFFRIPSAGYDVDEIIVFFSYFRNARLFSPQYASAWLLLALKHVQMPAVFGFSWLQYGSPSFSVFYFANEQCIKSQLKLNLNGLWFIRHLSRKKLSNLAPSPLKFYTRKLWASSTSIFYLKYKAAWPQLKYNTTSVCIIGF